MKSSDFRLKSRYKIVDSNVNVTLPVPFSGNIRIQPQPRTLAQNLKYEHATSLNNANLSNSKSEKIFYNPIFLRKTGEELHLNQGRSIHINPNFVPKKPSLSPKAVQINYKSEKDVKTSQMQSIHFNPRFLGKPNFMSSLNSRPVTSQPEFPRGLPSKSESKLTVSSNVPQCSTKVSKYSLDKRSIQPIPSKILRPRNQHLGHSQGLLKNYSLPPSKQSNHVTIPKPVLNNKYKKVNSVNQVNTVPSSKVVKSKYAIRRIPTKITPNRPTMVNTPSSFRKIGKRKLVRKSLLQNYISSRRFSTPYSLRHMRQIAQKKASRDPRTPLRSKYKIVRQTMRYSKDNRVKPRQSSDFFKISKRKIVRKSILSSVIEATRIVAISRRCKVVSRYKIRKVTKVPPVKNSFINKKIAYSKKPTPTRWMKHSFVLSKMSKSVMYRMRPGVRLRVKFEEKRLALLKKNNAKCSFYNRFGYCKGKDNGCCKKVHDQKSISVCKKYLLGECDNPTCKLNHTRSKEKMPTCHQFLAGVCVRENCPFLHVKLHAASSICRAFLEGFCSSGNACTKRHVFICPDWEAGSCPRKACPYPHPKPLNPCRKKPSVTKIKVMQPPKTIDLPKVEFETNDRYFDSTASPEVPSNMNDSQETEETDENQKKSVYLDESLLAFIPFSDD